MIQDKNQSWINLFKELLSARSFSLKVLFVLGTISLALSLMSSEMFHSAMALRQHQPETGTAFVSPSSSSPSQSAIATPSVPYYNSTYGIIFQSPLDWNKFELLSGRITTVGFISPTGHVSIVISIEKGLGKVSTLGQYDETAQKALHATLGNFINTAPRPATLLGQPAIARVLVVKQPVSGIHINIGQIFTLKNNKAYAITYTAPADMYSRYFPILQQVVNSFQITK